jgi:DNA modification methylase
MNQKKHKIIIGLAQNMDSIQDKSIDLVVTSPPYPMIQMWDKIMSNQNPKIEEALDSSNGQLAFELMHLELDKVWKEVERVLIPGGFACINIGDATRTINKEFALYPNHSRIISSFLNLGLTNLPNILWRKQTNAPNKFMGSGMLPSGAYVTLEHEWILIFRKGTKREFKTDVEKKSRKESSFFWEERNIWFSDLWDLKGVKQKVGNSTSRERSAAFPFEIPYRLINMYSLKGDTVLDPFLGTGTTTIAAIASERNSVGYEIDNAFLELARQNIKETSIHSLNEMIDERLNRHFDFVSARNLDKSKSPAKYLNKSLQTSVMTAQEIEIKFSKIKSINQMDESTFVSIYENNNQAKIELPKKSTKTYKELVS